MTRCTNVLITINHSCGVRQWRPQTMTATTMTATTMMATNDDNQSTMNHKPWWNLSNDVCSRHGHCGHHVFIAVAVVVSGHHGLWPSWYRSTAARIKQPVVNISWQFHCQSQVLSLYEICSPTKTCWHLTEIRSWVRTTTLTTNYCWHYWMTRRHRRNIRCQFGRLSYYVVACWRPECRPALRQHPWT